MNIEDEQNLVRNVMNNFLKDLVSVRDKEGSKHALNLLYREVNGDTIGRILPEYLKKLIHKYVTTHQNSKEVDIANLDEERVMETIPIVLRISLKIISLDNKDCNVYLLHL